MIQHMPLIDAANPSPRQQQPKPFLTIRTMYGIIRPLRLVTFPSYANRPSDCP